jgi:DNA polymerase-1
MKTERPGRVVLIDSYGLIYRAFHALPPLTTEAGQPINAAYGFTTMLGRIIAETQPDYLIAAFDKGPPQARLDRFPAYKAHRKETPDDLRSQFGLVRRILEAHGIPIVEMAGEEADDVIATLACAVEGRHEVLVITGDLDLLQIVDEQTVVVTPRRGMGELTHYDVAAVRERYGLEPAQLPDYRGLKGDPSDNLPGIPGFGPKTASALIARVGSLDALLADPTLAGSPRHEKLIREHGEAARLTRDLSVVARDLPIAFPWEEARYRPPDPAKLAPIYRELEFKGFLAKLAVHEAAAGAEAEPEPEVIEPMLVDGAYTNLAGAVDPPDFVKLAAALRALALHSRLAFAVRAEEIGVAWAPGAGLFFDRVALLNPEVAEAFRDLSQSVAEFAAHDAKALFAQLGERCPIRAVADDTMVAAHLVSPARAFIELDEALREWLDLRPGEHAAADADAVLRLASEMRARLDERGQISLYAELELPIVTLLARMEATGIAIDLGELTALAAEIDATVARLRTEIFALAGEEFNLDSPRQLGIILFEKLKLPGGKRKKAGYGTGVAILQELAPAHAIAARMLEYREVAKLKNTYVDVIPGLIGADGRLRTIYNQTTTATGRISSSNPNLQNIPVRGELGRRIRKAFVAGGPDRMLLAADYSQIELRLMAHLSGDERMRAAFVAGEEIHDVTARHIFGLGPGQLVEPSQRRIAKSVNFGLLYGMSEFGLAKRLGISRGEAKLMTEAYFARFPGVSVYIAATIAKGREDGYVATLLGRRRYLPELRSRDHTARSAAEREAANVPLQGGAADLMKLAMLRVAASLEGSGAQLLLQIHDELVLDVPRAGLKGIVAIVRREMEQAMELSVPLEVHLSTGATWFEVATYDEEELELGEAAEELAS